MSDIAVAAVIVSAVAIVVKALLLFAIYLQARAIGERVRTLAPKLESTLE